MPRSRATCATGCAESRPNRTASALNASVYRRLALVLMLSSDFITLLLIQVSVKSGEGQYVARPVGEGSCQPKEEAFVVVHFDEFHSRSYATYRAIVFRATLQFGDRTHMTQGSTEYPRVIAGLI